MHDILDRDAKLCRHLAAEVDRHAGIAGSVLLDQNAPPAGLIAIATRSLPVGAISSFRASAAAGVIIITVNPSKRPAIRGEG